MIIASLAPSLHKRTPTVYRLHMGKASCSQITTALKAAVSIALRDSGISKFEFARRMLWPKGTQCKSVAMMNSKIGRQPRGISEPKFHEDQDPCIQRSRSDRRDSMMPAITPKPENVVPLVRHIRGEKVLLDSDLAALYGVSTKVLNQAVKRNADRFPEDFMFQLSADEWNRLRSQIVTASKGPDRNRSQFVTGSRTHRGLSFRPYAFTEQGVAMLSSVLRSRRAVEVNIAIMRTFVQLRRLMDSNRDLARKIEAMEKRYDEQFASVFDAIKWLIGEDDSRKTRPKRGIGFLG